MTWNHEEDGITHINVYSKGKTSLGRFLTNFHDTGNIRTPDGYFRSIEGYWYWLSCGDNKLRNLSGFAAKTYGREARAKDWPEEWDNEFKVKISKAIEYKLFASTDYLGEILNSPDVPFVHYYVYGKDKIVPVKGCKWVLDKIYSVVRWVKFHQNNTCNNVDPFEGDCRLICPPGENRKYCVIHERLNK